MLYKIIKETANVPNKEILLSAELEAHMDITLAQ